MADPSHPPPLDYTPAPPAGSADKALEQAIEAAAVRVEPIVVRVWWRTVVRLIPDQVILDRAAVIHAERSGTKVANP